MLGCLGWRSNRVQEHLLGSNAGGGQQLEKLFCSLSVDVGTSQDRNLIGHEVVAFEEVPGVCVCVGGTKIEGDSDR